MHVATFAWNLPLALLTVVVWMALAFVVSRSRKRYATVDIFWGAGFLVIYLESLAFAQSQLHPQLHGLAGGPAARLALLAVVALWSLRLSIYLALRQRGGEEDPRYRLILRGAKGRSETRFVLERIFGFQGLLMFLISLPLQAAAASTEFSNLAWVGIAVALLGIAFESIGDAQLARFKADPAHAGKTMDRGLWRYTRHPNYFGDATAWTGFYLVAASTGWGALTILSPVIMWWLLTSLSGKPLLEARLTKTRAGYDDYVARTSSFLPWPPRRKA